MSDIPLIPTSSPDDGDRDDGFDDDAIERARAAVHGMPDHVGRYRILEHIGSGGMGEVYVADQTTPIRRRVALKLVKAGMDTRQVVARFEAERQALAMMDHPHIAKVFDAGATDSGRPYFVMELVRGLPITAYCDKHDLTIRERLGLFQQVCAAVQHAHQKGVIHRDLKPNNILVATEDGRPHARVIDFGIAKATGQQLTEKTLFTSHGGMVGTLEYMSPEQAEGSLDVDTRSDVYSLGVVLYELLTGSTPLDRKRFERAAVAEVQRIIREEEPPKPSTRLSGALDTLGDLAARRRTEPKRLGGLVRGDLDCMVMKALDKERARRYETPTGFGEDVQRYLDGSPVRAAPPSWAYRARKFSRKYRRSLAAAAASVLILIAGIAATTWQWQVARRNAAEAIAQTREVERQKADVERKQKQAEAIVDFINSDVFAGATPERMPDPKLRDEIVVKMLYPATLAIGERFANQPLVKAAVMNQIGQCHQMLGRNGAAYPLLKDSLDLYRGALGPDHPDTIVAQTDFAAATQAMGHFDEAGRLFKEAYDHARRVLGDDHPNTIVLQYGLGSAQGYGSREEAGRLLRDVLGRARRVLGDDHPLAISARNNLASVLFSLGRRDEAEPMLRDALERSRRVRGGDNADTISSIYNYASMLRALGRDAEAEPLVREALERRRRVLGDGHISTIGGIYAVAELLETLGRLPEAEPLYREVFEGHRRGLGADHIYSIGSTHNYARVLHELGRDAEAEPLVRESLEHLRGKVGADHPDTVPMIGNRVAILNALGRSAEAEPLAAEAWDRARRLLAADHENRARALDGYAGTLRALGRAAEADALVAAHRAPTTVPTTRPAGGPTTVRTSTP